MRTHDAGLGRRHRADDARERNVPDRDDRFIRVEQGQARVEFGTAEDRVDATYDVEEGWAIVIPVGVWHDVINTGTGDLRLSSLCSPPEHAPGTIHRTEDETEARERI